MILNYVGTTIKNKVFYVLSMSLLVMSERKYKYHTVNLPEALAKKIVEVVDSKEHGYTNVPDFVKAAVRRYLRELEYLT